MRSPGQHSPRSCRPGLGHAPPHPGNTLAMQEERLFSMSTMPHDMAPMQHIHEPLPYTMPRERRATHHVSLPRDSSESSRSVHAFDDFLAGNNGPHPGMGHSHGMSDPMAGQGLMAMPQGSTGNSPPPGCDSPGLLGDFANGSILLQLQTAQQLQQLQQQLQALQIHVTASLNEHQNNMTMLQELSAISANQPLMPVPVPGQAAGDADPLVDLSCLNLTGLNPLQPSQNMVQWNMPNS